MKTRESAIEVFDLNNLQTPESVESAIKRLEHVLKATEKCSLILVGNHLAVDGWICDNRHLLSGTCTAICVVTSNARFIRKGYYAVNLGLSFHYGCPSVLLDNMEAAKQWLRSL